MVHQTWEELLLRMSKGNKLKSKGGNPQYDPGGSPDMLAKVLTRVALADGPVPRSAISKGSMLIRPSTLASATVGKAVDALVGEGLLTEEDSKKSGRPGPGSGRSSLSDKWAIIGIHIGQQHDGPDELAGIICGLDRKPLTELLRGEVPREGDRHDKHRLAEKIRELTESLLEQLDSPRKFLGVGIEIGGHVYHGIVKDSVHAGWSQKVDLHQILADELSEIPELRGSPGRRRKRCQRAGHPRLLRAQLSKARRHAGQGAQAGRRRRADTGRPHVPRRPRHGCRARPRPRRTSGRQPLVEASSYTKHGRRQDLR